MLRRNRNRANLPAPGNNPGQTIQNAANHNTGVREQSKRRRFSKGGVASIAAGAALLGSSATVGEFLSHTPDQVAGPNRAEQILDQGAANRRDLHCLIGSFPTSAALDPDGSVKLSLNLESGYGNDSSANTISYGMVYEKAAGKFALAGDLHRTNQPQSVIGLLSPDAVGKPVAVYALVSNGAGGYAASKLCGTDFSGETLTAQVPQGQPNEVEFKPGAAGDFQDGNIPLSVFEGN